MWLLDLFKKKREYKEMVIKSIRAKQDEMRMQADEYWGRDIDREKYDSCIRDIMRCDALIEYYQNDL